MIETVIPFPVGREPKPRTRTPKKKSPRPEPIPEITTEEVAAMFDGNKMRRARVLADLTRQDVAERLCVSPQYVGQWETGTGLPPASLIRLLGEILGYPIGYFKFKPGNSVNLDGMYVHYCESQDRKSCTTVRLRANLTAGRE